MRKNRGFSLIESVVFIVVIALATTGIFLALSTSLQKIPYINPETTTIELAKARMDIILGNRRLNGFTSLSDPCTAGSPPAICTVPPAITGYTITSSITPLTIGSDSNYKIIDVIVTGPHNAKGELKTMVASY